MLGLTSGLTHGESFVKDDTDYTSLTGESGFIVPYTNNAPFNDNYTVSLWFKTSDGRQGSPFFPGGYRNFMTLISDVNPVTDKYHAIILGISPTGALRLSLVVQVHPSGELIATTSISDDVLADGAVDWTHLAYVVTGGNGSDTVIAMYINGEESSGYTVQDFGGGITSALHDAFINDNGVWISCGGSLDNDSSTPTPLGTAGIHHGTEFIDDFALHSAALDAAAITAVYNSGTPINLLADSGDYDNSSDVVLYYKFNGKFDGDALLDSHGTQNALQGNGTQFSTESAT